MDKVTLTDMHQQLLDSESAAPMRVYVTAASKGAAVVKEDDLLTKAEIQAHPFKVSRALCTEPRIWHVNNCFRTRLPSEAANVMTSRFVYTRKCAKTIKAKLNAQSDCGWF